ncbi:MAG TPA: class I SAM-dependent methyltransferase [Vitreimonas sp.]|uniref:class I SAM-dependent methyltransferase n=1 Tax=Vitreimonas sp. TaxID=3069702 RepID=UPI002D4785FA|nr:class I SAM-dependent methyltransferase [Vitreimonas sp.]HYD89448.1 class I SAM-dependent methyltransferase [Vitreimonas sp.]
MDFPRIARCPETGATLVQTGPDQLTAEDGRSYRIEDGIARLLPRAPGADETSIVDFYEGDGWEQDGIGLYADTRKFVDTRPVSLAFTRRCIRRLGAYFRRGGRYLLDAGSGALPHNELIEYGDAFDKRVCVDLSFHALRAARRKLGDRGIYLQGDITNIPVADNSMDAITCNHVIYQIPPEHQRSAFLELWRVLRPGGVAVIVYWWPNAPLGWRTELLAKRICGSQPRERARETDDPHLLHAPQSRAWFESQDWPFRYQYDVFRVIDNGALRRSVSNDWRGRLFLSGLYACQAMAPRLCGKHGMIPAIVMHKD